MCIRDRDMGFQAVCIGYMLCKKYGVDTQNFAIDRIPAFRKVFPKKVCLVKSHS